MHNTEHEAFSPCVTLLLRSTLPYTSITHQFAAFIHPCHSNYVSSIPTHLSSQSRDERYVCWNQYSNITSLQTITYRFVDQMFVPS